MKERLKIICNELEEITKNSFNRIVFVDTKQQIYTLIKKENGQIDYLNSNHMSYEKNLSQEKVKIIIEKYVPRSRDIRCRLNSEDKFYEISKIIE